MPQQYNLYSVKGKEARGYLASRKLSDEIIKEFQLGLSLDEPNILTEALKKKYDDATLIKSGLVNEGEYDLYDIYRNRIMFPLYDLAGNIVGYNGRIYNSNNKKILNLKICNGQKYTLTIYNEKMLKYLNEFLDYIKVKGDVHNNLMERSKNIDI